MDDVQKFLEDPRLNGKKKDGTPLRVIIVDDSLAHRRVLAKLLESVGYKVVAEAGDGQDGVNKYFEHKPDILTLDISMPGMEGDLAVAEIIKKDMSAKIVMITSIGHKELVEKCIYRGARGYILKPITTQQIPKILETIKSATL